MGKIKKITENELVGGIQTTDVYPVTSVKAVYDENNERLDSILNRRGVVNISTNYNSDHTAEVLTLEQAIAKIPSSDRVLGFTGTFLTSNGWESYQFIGSSISEWLDAKKWKEGNTSKFSTLGFYSDSKLKVGEPYIDPDTGLDVVNVTLNSLGSNGTFMDFSGAWSNSSDSLDKSTSCPIRYGAVCVCCKQEDSTSLKIVGIGYGISSKGKYSSTEFFKSHKGWNINIIAYFHNGNLVLDNTIKTKYLSDEVDILYNNIIHYPKNGFELNASYGISGEANRIWCVNPKAFRCNNEIIGVVVDCGNLGANTKLTIVKVKDGVPAEELKSIEVYKRGIYTVYFDSPISLSDEYIGVECSKLNVGYKLHNGDYSFFEFDTNGSRKLEYLGATLNIAFIEKKNALAEKISYLQNKSLGNLGFYSLLEAEVSDFDNNFKTITFKNLEKGVSYVDFGSGSYIDNVNITIESSSIKVPNNYAIIGLATKRLDSRHSIAKLICWGIGNSEENIYSEYNSEKVLSQYHDYSINVLAYYQGGKVYLNSIPNLYNKIEADNNDIILQSKYGFIEGNRTGVSGFNGTSYWTFNLLDPLSDTIDILGVVVEACSAGTIEVVKIHEGNPISVEVLTSKEVEKAGVYKIWFDSPVSVDNNYNIGVNSTNNAGNATFRYKLNNNDYGLTEYHESNGVVSNYITYRGATLNIALLRKRDANTLAGEEAISIPAFSHIDAPIIYNTYIDSKGSVPALERSYQAIIQLDHLLNGLTEEYNIRFNNNKDIIQTSAPVYVNSGDDFSTASYVVLDNKESKEYNSNIKVLFENNPVYEFTLTNRCVRASVSKNKKPLVLCIGDSITDGQQALLYEDGLKNRYSFHDICLEMFMKDKIDAGNSGYDIEMLGTKSRSRKFKYNNAEYTVKTYHEGYGGSIASAWLNGTVGGGVFKKDNSTLFSISAWVNKYRTLSDDGRRLYFGTNRETTGVAGDNWGYYEDGAKSNYKLGTLVTNVESYNVCVPTHIHINLGANATTSVEQWQQFINIIHSEYPNVIIGLSVFDTAGTYFPSLHRDYDDSFCFWNEYANNPNIGIDANISYHNKQFNTQVNLQNFYGKENEKVYVLPFFYCTPSVESASYRKLSAPLDDLLGRQPSKLMYGWGGIYHINPLAHSYCAYQFYSWIKWTLAN